MVHVQEVYENWMLDQNADRKLVLATVQKTGRALQFAAEPLKADREVVLEAVKQNGYALVCAAEPLKADVEVVLAGVKMKGVGALIHASLELQNDIYLQRLAVCAGRPTRLTAFLAYARDLREANVKAKVDLWITSHNGGELHHWMDATHVGFKRMKRARLDEETARDC